MVRVLQVVACILGTVCVQSLPAAPKPFYLLALPSTLTWTPVGSKTINITVVNGEGRIVSVVEESARGNCNNPISCSESTHNLNEITWTPTSVGRNLHFEWSYKNPALSLLSSDTSDNFHSQSQLFDIFASEEEANASLGGLPASLVTSTSLPRSSAAPIPFTSDVSSFSTSTLMVPTTHATSSITKDRLSATSFPTSAPSSTQSPQSSPISISTPIRASSSSNHLSKGAIAGIVISVVAFLAAIILLALLCIRKRKRTSQTTTEFTDRTKEQPATFEQMSAGGYSIPQNESEREMGRAVEGGGADYMGMDRDENTDSDGRVEYLKQPRTVISAMGQESPEELARLQAEEELLDREIAEAERVRGLRR